MLVSYAWFKLRAKLNLFKRRNNSMQLPPFSARIMPVKNEAYMQKGFQVAVLRLDEIHPVISGNKWFKFKAYLQDAAAAGKKTVLTFRRCVLQPHSCYGSGLPIVWVSVDRHYPGRSTKRCHIRFLKHSNTACNCFLPRAKRTAAESIPDAVFDRFKEAFM
jgi:hypothetical protein